MKDNNNDDDERGYSRLLWALCLEVFGICLLVLAISILSAVFLSP